MGTRNLSRGLTKGFAPYIQQKTQEKAEDRQFGRQQTLEKQRFARQGERDDINFARAIRRDATGFDRKLSLARTTADLNFEMNQKLAQFKHTQRTEAIEEALGKVKETGDLAPLYSVLPQYAKDKYDEKNMSAADRERFRIMGKNADAALIRARNAGENDLGAEKNERFKQQLSILKEIPIMRADPNAKKQYKKIRAGGTDRKPTFKEVEIKTDDPLNPEYVRTYDALVEEFGYAPKNVPSPHMEYNEKSIKSFEFIHELATAADSREPGTQDRKQQAKKALKTLQSRANSGDQGAIKMLNHLSEITNVNYRVGLISGDLGNLERPGSNK